MAHDELLDSVKEAFGVDRPYELFKALRAVVELHKPKSNSYYEIKGFKGCTGCEHTYPCPTIEAIEKELGWHTLENPTR